MKDDVELRVNVMANQPAAGKAGIAPLFAVGHHYPGLPEPGRWVI
jgi:hypothetical protein